MAFKFPGVGIKGAGGMAEVEDRHVFEARHGVRWMAIEDKAGRGMNRRWKTGVSPIDRMDLGYIIQYIQLYFTFKLFFFFLKSIFGVLDHSGVMAMQI